MKSLSVFNLFLVLILAALPGYCQGMMEFGNSQAMSAGLGAGLAATYGSHSQAIKRSYQSIINTQQSALEQTKAIEKYMKCGCQLQPQKKWADAELAFHYVLQVISRRDGPGSSKSIPALEHLVSVTQAQNKLEDAIKYQQTVVAFKKAEKILNPFEIISAETNLSNLCIQNNDYKGAASVLRDSVSYYDSHPSLPVTAKQSTLSSYAKVLRKLHKDEEAKSVEATIASQDIMSKDNGADAAKESTEPPPSVELLPVPVEQPKAKQ